MYAISIDSGGTKVVGAVVDGDGNILTKKRYDIPERDGNFLIATFRDIISQYSGEYPISVVGIGGNGRIDPVEGVILNCGVHANWQGRHLRKELEDDFHIPVSVNNDCYCAIKGELKGGRPDILGGGGNRHRYRPGGRHGLQRRFLAWGAVRRR